MLNLYINRAPDKIQYYNDAFFDLSIENRKIDEAGKKIIKRIDDVEYAGNNSFYSKFEKNIEVSITELSTGCKTALNIYYYPDVIFYIGSCGKNAKRVILSYPEGNIFINNYFIPEDFSNAIRVFYNGMDAVVKNNKELFLVLNKIYGD